MAVEVGISDVKIGTWLLSDPVHRNYAQTDKQNNPLIMYIKWPSGAKSPWLLVQGCFERQ